MNLTSSSFADGERIPEKYTCEGQDVSPPLSWDDVPDDTTEFALTCEDPDAPGRTFVHWVMWGIDPTLIGLEEGRVPSGARLGRNDFGRAGYGGPCPPPGDEPHRYRFTLYALDVPSIALEHPTREELERKIEPHVLATSRLVGRYRRQRVAAR
jgi:Raf kinase inhibitor-like YbhB/YbcL family protein